MTSSIVCSVCFDRICVRNFDVMCYVYVHNLPRMILCGQLHNCIVELCRKIAFYNIAEFPGKSANCVVFCFVIILV